MKVEMLIEHLKMFPSEMEVLVQGSPNDLCSPIARKNIRVSLASNDERYGLEQSKLILTAYIPMEDK